MTKLPYDHYKATRDYETPRSSKRRYILVGLLIAAIFVFCLGVLVGATA